MLASRSIQSYKRFLTGRMASSATTKMGTNFGDYTNKVCLHVVALFTKNISEIMIRYSPSGRTKVQTVCLRLFLRAGRKGETSELFVPAFMWCMLSRVLLFNCVRWQAIASGQAPDVTGTETPYRLGYCTITLLGAQRGADAFPLADHVGTMKLLISSGAPTDSADIAGHTALHHASKSVAGPTLSLVRVLLESGANVNKQNIYGEIPLFGAFMLGDARLVDVMMEFGADVDLPEANGWTARRMFVSTGPSITATITKWLRKRNGEQKPLDGKACAQCGKADVSLKMCSKCHAVRYCSTECQSTSVLCTNPCSYT